MSEIRRSDEMGGFIATLFASVRDDINGGGGLCCEGMKMKNATRPTDIIRIITKTFVDDCLFSLTVADAMLTLE